VTAVTVIVPSPVLDIYYMLSIKTVTMAEMNDTVLDYAEVIS